ncbi:MAG TPA: MotA/TolQ/ExbB proton channel family protein [Nevskiaceae bacterium]|nr:MotA/TolQ/ExbB proton channel family protein [Nevskiaceae bacterium]
MLDWLLAPVVALHRMRELGGPVVDYIFLSCLVMWTLVVERWWYYNRVLPRQASALLEAWYARPDRHTWTSHQVRRAMISQLKLGMAANMQVLRMMVPLCPLLGLLGTVAGMLSVFDAMAARGSADARSMANGVSEAMICTLTGLAVSVTGLYPVYYFQGRARLEAERLADKFVY